MKRKQNYAERFLPVNVSPYHYQNVGNWEDPGKWGTYGHHGYMIWLFQINSED